MTIIAFDGKMIAADRRIVSGNVISTAKKIFQCADGVIGYAGTAVYAIEFIDWFMNSRIAESFPAFLSGKEMEYDILFVDNKKQVRYYNGTPYPIKSLDKRAAIGNGAEAGMMAMMLGLSAEKAVIEVSKLIPSCGSGVDKIIL